MLDDILQSNFLNLNNIYRFSNTRLIIRESTAEHTMSMQLIALYFYNKFPELKIEDICMRILYHDLDECVCADIPRSIKYASTESYELINSITKSQLEKSSINDSIVSKIFSSKHDGTWEGYFVQLLDSFQCTIKLLDEFRLQNNTTIKSRLVDGIRTLEDVISGDKFSNVDYQKEIIHIFKILLVDLYREVR